MKWDEKDYNVMEWDEMRCSGWDEKDYNGMG